MRKNLITLGAPIVVFLNFLISCGVIKSLNDKQNSSVHIKIQFEDYYTVKLMVMNKSNGDVYIPEGFDNDHLDFYYLSDKGDDFPTLSTSKFRRITNGLLYDKSNRVLPKGLSAVYVIDIRKLHGLTATAEKMWKDAQVSNCGLLKVKVVVSGQEIENEVAMDCRLYHIRGQYPGSVIGF